MSSWHMLNVGKPVEALPRILEIQKQLIVLVSATDRPAHIEVLQAKSSSASEQVLYFYPDIWRLAKSFGATPCDQPDRQQCTKLF